MHRVLETGLQVEKEEDPGYPRRAPHRQRHDLGQPLAESTAKAWPLLSDVLAAETLSPFGPPPVG